MADERVINVLFHGVGTPRRELARGVDRYWVTLDRFHSILDELTTLAQGRISFDDGNASDAEIALPALLERGLRADFFVLAGRLGTPGSLDADAVRELAVNGMGIGSHGMRHQSWRGMDANTRHAEVVAAACPMGRYDRRVLTVLRALGYRRVFTSDRRPARRSAWLQPRYSVLRDDTAATIRDLVLSRPPLPRRIRSAAASLVKSWR